MRGTEEYNRHINELENLIIWKQEEINKKKEMKEELIKYYDDRFEMEDKLSTLCDEYLKEAYTLLHNQPHLQDTLDSFDENPEREYTQDLSEQLKSILQKR